MLHVERRKTCFVYSCGGHYTELRKALAGLEFENFYDVTMTSDRFEGKGRVYFITHPKKSVFRLAINAIQSLIILVRERPKLIISTGADVAVATLLLSKLLPKCQVIFIESLGSYNPTLTGRIVYPVADLFVIQSGHHHAAYPRAVLAKGLLY